MNLLPCTRCAAPILANTMECPCCGAAVEDDVTVRPIMVLMGLVLSGCEVSEAVALYGAAITDTGFIDADGDGFAPVDGDCDDDDPDIHPEAEETPGDDVDANCNGEDDT